MSFLTTERSLWRVMLGASVVIGIWSSPQPILSQTTPPPEQRTAVLSNSPAQWLDHKGKPDAWYAATDRCRRLLHTLDVDDPLVKSYLPNIRRYAEIIGRVSAFDWKTITAVEFLQHLLEDLSAGQQPNRRYAGNQLAFPYWSDTMQRIEAIWTHVPLNYDPAKSYQVFMYYKCGGGIYCKDGRAAGGYRPTIEVANQTDSFHCWSSLDIQIKGRMGGYIELSEAMDALCREFHVDRDRVFLTGWSDGGFTAVWLASHYPHLVAGIAPNCGNWQYTNVEYLGLTNLPTLNVDGWFDGGYNRISFVRWLMLRHDQADTACIWGQHGHSYQPYEDVEEFKYIHEWAKQYRRDLFPKRVHYATWNLAWHRAYWASIERMIDPLFASQIDLEIEPDNRIEGRTWNVAKLKLSMGNELVDMTRPVKVIINDREVYKGPAEKELDIEMIELPQSPLVKDADMPDEITAATVGSSYDTNGFLAIPQRRWISVRPTGLDEATNKLLSGWWPEHAKADSSVTDRDLVEYNLILYGGPEMNKLTARMASRLPVTFYQGRFSIGADVYGLPTHCISFLTPNPLNPQKYVIVYACNDPAAFVKNDFFGMRGESIYKFRSGDAVISGIPAEPIKWGVAVRQSAYKQRHVIFGADWRPDERPPLGEAEHTFDYLQLLRMRADALREAADVDVGIIWAHTPAWARWDDNMPHGPITLHALATQDAFPEQVCVGKMRGEDLLSPQSAPAAWSLLEEKRDPNYVAGKTLAVSDIDPGKTYRVAMGFHGIPAYGTNPKQMPRLFDWGTAREFLANTDNSIRIQNLTRTPLQVAEAVAQYVREHPKISPRPTYFNLTDYIINPHYNHFNACDWLHLATDVAWPDPVAGGTERYTVSLGLLPLDVADLAEPRTGAKHFAELDLGQGAPASFDFRNLPMKLPLDVTTAIRRWAITVDLSGKSCALSDRNVDGPVGRATLLLLRLSNKADKDLVVQVVLNRAVMSRIYSEVWPDASCKDKDVYFAGYHRAIGQYREPPVYEDGVLFLSGDNAPVLSKLIADNAGYNFGLVGLKNQATVQAGRTLVVPLLVVWVKRPEKAVEFNLLEVLTAVKADLIRQLPTENRQLQSGESAD